MTAHRRENFGQPLINIFTAILEILKKHPDVDVLYPVHPNPNVQKLAYEMLGNQERVWLCEPLDYFDFVTATQDKKQSIEWRILNEPTYYYSYPYI